MSLSVSTLSISALFQEEQEPQQQGRRRVKGRKGPFMLPLAKPFFLNYYHTGAGVLSLSC